MRKKLTRTALVIACLLLVGVALLWLLRGKDEVRPTPESDRLLVPRELARKFGLTVPEGVVTRCQEKIRPADYEGILRGAHGALWGQEANEWDRILLAAAALKAEGVEALVVPGDPPALTYHRGRWITVRMDSDARPQKTGRPPDNAVSPSKLASAHPELFNEIRPVLVLEPDGGEPQRISSKTPQHVAEWVYQPVILSVEPDKGSVRYVLRIGDREILVSGPLEKVRRAVLELTWHFGDRDIVWERELFDRQNANVETPGHDTARVNDRYAIVLAAGPLVPEVLSTRAKMLQSPLDTPLDDPEVRDLVLMATKYQVDSDKHVDTLAKETDVQVAWTRPRITITASEIPPDEVQQMSDNSNILSIDALADRVEATGKQARQFLVARGMANDAMESRVLFEVARMPVLSASTILSRYKAPADPESPEWRIALIESEAKRIMTEEPIGTRLKLKALPPRALREEDAGPPSNDEQLLAMLLFERTRDGFVLQGLDENPEVKEGKVSDRYRWGNDQSSIAFGSDTVALAVVADAMLSNQVNRPNYHLGFKLIRALASDPLPIAAGCVLNYMVQHEGKEYSISVPVFLKDGLPSGKWLTIPQGVDWVSTNQDNYGDITGLWPEVISTTPIGPALETFLAPAAVGKEGETLRHPIYIGNRQQVIEAVKVSLADEPGSFVEVKSGNNWHPATFERENGFVRKRRGRYYVRFIASTPSETDLVPKERWRPLEPMELQVDGKWCWVNVLETKEEKFLVHLCGEPESAQQWVPQEQLRPMHIVEVKADGKWLSANLLQTKDDRHRVHYTGHGDDEDEWVTQDRIRFPDQYEAKEPYAVVLPAPEFPLVVEWGQGDTYLRLRKVTPVLTGSVVDQQTKLPVGNAVVERSDGKWQVRTAVDGSFTIPVDDALFTWTLVTRQTMSYRHPGLRNPRTFRLLFIVDESAAMGGSLDPKAGGEATPNKRRHDGLRQAVKTFLSRLASNQDRVEITLWSYTTPPDYSGAFEEPDVVTERLHTSNVYRVHELLEKLEWKGQPPLTGAINKLVKETRQGSLSDDVIVVLWTSGENACKTKTALQAYREGRCSVPIHIFGFGVKPGSANDKELSELAQVSSGSYRSTAEKEPFSVAMYSFNAKVAPIGLQVMHPCYRAERVSLPMDELGQKPVDLQLTHARYCDQEDRGGLLTIGKDNLADLARCEGLSGKAWRMIKERVKDGKWKVTIPTRRTNIASITAYGWFETEIATGRLVGRTEDGLHGSIAHPLSWPPFRRKAGKHPFIAWYHGVVAYTTGSVKSAFDWRNSPGFLSGSAKDFSRFVQANALEYAAGWWAEVGKQAFPEFSDHYWAGVCLNFNLQSAALGLPSNACLQLWAEDLCNRMADAFANAVELAVAPGLVVADNVTNFLNEHFGEEKNALIQAATQNGAEDIISEMRDLWRQGVKMAFDCEQRFRRK